MTVIIAARKGNRAAIAADTRCTTDGFISRDDTKVQVFSFGHAGFAGGLREGQLVAAAWRGVTKAETPRDMEELAALASKALSKEEGGEGGEGGSAASDDFEAIILTTKRRIWVLDSALAFRDGGKLAAIGSGSGIALGAATALLGWNPGMQPTQIADEAVRAACKHVSSCGLPVLVFD